MAVSAHSTVDTFQKKHNAIMAGDGLLATTTGKRTSDLAIGLSSKSNFAHSATVKRFTVTKSERSPTLLRRRQYHESILSKTDIPAPENCRSILEGSTTRPALLHSTRGSSTFTADDGSERKSNFLKRASIDMQSRLQKGRRGLYGAEKQETEGQAATKRQKLFIHESHVAPSGNVLLSRRRAARNDTPDSSGDEDTASTSANSAEDAEPLFVSPGMTPTRERSSTIQADKHTTPSTRTMDHQRRLDRAAVKSFIENRIKPSGKNSVWNLADRWSFVMSSYDDKLKEREQAGGSWRSLWPEQYRAWGQRQDTDWLQKTFSGYLLGVPSPAASGQHEGFQDEDDEEIVVKREEIEAHEAQQNDLDTQSPMSSSSGKTRRRLKTMHRQHRSRGGSNEDYEVHASSFKTRGSTLVPEAADPEWRQYWEMRNDGSAVLVTPRTWKWNSSCELVAWPPLEYILPPLEPIPQPQNTE